MKRKLNRGISAVIAAVLVLSVFFTMTTTVSADETEAAGSREATAYALIDEDAEAEPIDIPAEEAEDVIPESLDKEAEAPAEEMTETVEIDAELSADEAVDAVNAAADEAFEATCEEEFSFEKQQQDIADTAAPATTPTVGAITDIVQTDATGNELVVAWNRVEGITGYNIYWRGLDKPNTKFAFLATSKYRKYHIRNLTPGRLYEVKIAAFKIYDGKAYEGKAKSIKVATRFNKVAGFTTEYNVKYIQLRWKSVPMADGYVLYRRGGSSGTTWKKYMVLKKDLTALKDKIVEQGQPYYYRIAAYRGAQKNIVGYLAETRAVCGLTTSNDGSYAVLNRVFLSWKKCRWADGYQIYFSHDNKNYKFWKATTATSITTDRLSKIGTKYYFRIYPYKYCTKNRDFVKGFYTVMNFTPTRTIYGRSTGSTYVEVSIREQHMWFYENGKLSVSTDVVTGNYGTNGTPKGYWSIYQKTTNTTLTGPGYASFVNYWMAFKGGCGIHDASWRDTFGGQIYKGNGSHGCVNTPYDNVRKIYNSAPIGTPVIVY